MTSPRWLHQWPEKGPPLFRIGRAGDDLVAEWIGLGTLRADVAGTWNEFVPQDGHAHSLHAQERLREHVVALLRHVRGGITLHASGVARRGTGLAFVGESGAGKSTLAIQLCATPEVELLADDTLALVLDQPLVAVAPGERIHWLRTDVARALGIDVGQHPKIPREAARPAAAPVRLGAIVSLVFDEHAPSPALSRLRGTKAFSALGSATFRFALDVAEVLRGELDQLARVAEQVPVFELRRPPGLANLETSPREILRLLDELSDEGRDR